jgi:hypothetical protein
MATELSRDERIDLAVCYYGWYTFGMAATDSERCDEDCAMDNGGVPRYADQLTEKHIEVLDRLKRVPAHPIESIDAILARHPEWKLPPLN